MERERLRGEAGDAMEDVEEEDTVPEILPRHFEDAALLSLAGCVPI